MMLKRGDAREEGEQLMLMMLALGGAHHEHQLDRLCTAEKMCEITATRRVYERPVFCPRGATDAHDAGPGA